MGDFLVNFPSIFPQAGEDASCWCNVYTVLAKIRTVHYFVLGWQEHTPRPEGAPVPVPKDSAPSSTLLFITRMGKSGTARARGRTSITWCDQSPT